LLNLPIFVEKDLQVNDLSVQKGNFWAMTCKIAPDSNMGYEIANISAHKERQWASSLASKEY